MKKLVFTAIAASIMLTQTGCFGSFALVNKIYEFNDGASDNKILKTLLMYVLYIVPVYQVSAFLDLVIFNLIEFWGGSNPIAMEEGQVEEQFMAIKGENYKVTATKNQMVFEKLENGEMTDMGTMVYSPETKVWSFEKEDQVVDLIKISDNNTAEFNTVNGFQTLDISNVENMLVASTNKNFILN